jgi:hypothetical protein
MPNYKPETHHRGQGLLFVTARHESERLAERPSPLIESERMPTLFGAATGGSGRFESRPSSQSRPLPSVAAQYDRLRFHHIHVAHPLFVAAPLKIRGATGSPIRPLAVVAG